MRRQRRLARALEFTAVFVGFPLLLHWLRSREVDLPVVPVLLGTSLVIVGAYALLRRHELREGFRWRWNAREARRVATLFAAACTALVAYTWLALPELFGKFPAEHPGRWALLMASYPLLSVLPQEVVFRVFLFARYRSILTSPSGAVAVSALVFGLSHIVFANWTAVLLSTAGGLLFAWTYLRTRSLWMVVAEHTLYGWALFTSGIGLYFYDGTFGPMD